MRTRVGGRETYAYTGARAPAAAQRTLVFVHGAANDHSVWSLQSRYFAHHGWNVLAFDLPGHGRSEGPPLPSVEALAQWIAEATAAAGVVRYALVGHSMGALASLEHAARYPDRVERLLLLGAAVPMVVSDALLDAALHDEAKAHELITGWSHSPPHQLGGNRLPGVWLPAQTLRLMERGAPGVLHTDLTACRAYDGGLKAAAKVSCPSLLVSAERDLMAPPRGLAPLAHALGGLKCDIGGAGHAMMTEAPDAVLDALRGFLDMTFGRSGSPAP
jgi:pimeloyl-ACP methyl ester carboxylesterase